MARDNIQLIHTNGIVGYGLFTKIPFVEGEYILDFRGEILPHEICGRKHIRLNEYFSFELPNRNRMEYYINHSCHPNCYICFAAGWPSLVALRKIKKGDQLTINYCGVFERVESFDCYCGAVVCLGRIKGYQSLTLADKICIQDELSPYLRSIYEEEKAH